VIAFDQLDRLVDGIDFLNITLRFETIDGDGIYRRGSGEYQNSITRNFQSPIFPARVCLRIVDCETFPSQINLRVVLGLSDVIFTFGSWPLYLTMSAYPPCSVVGYE